MIGRTVYVKRKSTETYEQNRVIDIRIPAVVEKQLSSADWDVIPERCSVGIDLALLHLSKTQIPRRTILPQIGPICVSLPFATNTHYSSSTLGVTKMARYSGLSLSIP